jgi:tetratricopeptide (TPR) repeat protein
MIASCAAITVLALSVRLACLVQVQDIGFLAQPISDARIYVDRAHGIVRGDWLGPAEFVHAPLYAYQLALVLAVADPVWAPRIVQCVLGALTCVVLALAGRSLFGRFAGWLSGVMLAAYPPAIFFDMQVQKTNLELLLATVLVAQLVRSGKHSALQSGAAGVTLGLLALTRQNALLLAPLLLAWVYVTFRAETARRRWTAVGLLAAGFVLATAPWVARNQIVLGELVLSTPNLGQNFAMGNSAGATGTYRDFGLGHASAELEQAYWVRTAAEALGREPSAQEVSAYYLRLALRWIAENPGAWLALTAKKAWMTWNAYEAYDTEDYYLYAQHSAILAGLDHVWHFGILTPLAALGLCLTAQRWRVLWPLYGWLVLSTLFIVAFVVFARYRVVLLPVLILFAAGGLDEAARRLARGAYRSMVPGAAALIGVGILANIPIDHRRTLDAVSYTNHAAALLEVGRLADAERELRRALELSAQHVHARLLLSNVLTAAGHCQEALRLARDLQARWPQFGAVHRAAGDAWLCAGATAEAAAAYHEALRVDPRDARAMALLGTALARGGQLEHAIQWLRRAIDLRPDYADAHLNLGNTLLAAGRLDEAVGEYELALRLRPTAAAWNNLGETERLRGRTDRAAACFEESLRLEPGFESARRALAQLRAPPGP